ncbi:hypothetical protein EC957_003756 [Mortierella hygrophila]|uniref:Transcription initiation factor TFIID subunit 4 n=1 Tax=Mortierella hygrophila TaxID=979708 RepID=A0A9P6K0Y6_9FUNG|nr:hypothetical protein EC957_003756 [Mortierella hygrophila]
MKERKTSPSEQKDPQNPTRRRIRSSSHLPTPSRTTTTISATFPTAIAATVVPSFTGQKRSAEEQEERAKRASPSLSKTPFSALPSTSSRPALPLTSSLALPPTSLRPSSGAPAPSIRTTTSSASAISGSTCIASATGAQKRVGVHGAEGTSSMTVARGGGGFEFDMLDVMGYVEFDLMDEANDLFKFTSRPVARRGSNDSGSEFEVRGIPTAQDFMKEGILAATVMRFVRKHELLTVDREVIAYLALATKQRLRTLIERMIQVSRHRRKSSSKTFGPPPMYDTEHAMFHLGIGQDVKKQLLAIERVDREEELKYKENIAVLREQKLAAGAAASEIARDGGDGKAKRVRFGNIAKVKEAEVVLTGEEKMRFVNQTALKFAGNRGQKRAYAWMGGSGGVLKRPQDPDLTVLDPSSPSSSDYSLGATVAGARFNRGLCNPLGKVNVKDALFCLEHDCDGEGLKVLIRNYVK